MKQQKSALLKRPQNVLGNERERCDLSISTKLFSKILQRKYECRLCRTSNVFNFLFCLLNTRFHNFLYFKRDRDIYKQFFFMSKKPIFPFQNCLQISRHLHQEQQSLCKFCTSSNTKRKNSFWELSDFKNLYEWSSWQHNAKEKKLFSLRELSVRT